MMERMQALAVGPNPSGDRPRINPSAYLDPSARIIGRLEIGPRVFVGPFAVIRADEVPESGVVAPITIGPECNVQDGVIMHALAGRHITIGRRVSMSHGCIVHGPCDIDDNCFIGFRSVVFKSTVGAGSYIGTGAVVEGVELPPHTLVPAGTSVNSPEAVLRLSKTGSKEREFMEDVVEMNIRLAEGYLGLEKVNS